MISFWIFQYCFYYSFTLYYYAINFFERWIVAIPSLRVSNSLDPDQARHYVGPGLGPNYLQRLSADDKLLLADKELNTKQFLNTTFWLKPWLKSTSFGSNFFHMAKYAFFPCLSYHWAEVSIITILYMYNMLLI